MEPPQDAAGISPETLVRKYGEMVYNLALRLTGNPRDAEDLAQDALVRGVRGLAGFKGKSDPGTWLYRITHNAWKNRVRSEKRRGLWKLLSLDFSTEEDEGPPEVSDGSPPLESALEKDEERAAVEAALAALEPEDRAILALRELDGLDYAGIAASLGVPVGTVKSRIHRARGTLREKLKGYLHGT